MSGLDFRSSKGFSLVELLVALALSLVIGLAVMQMFLTSKTTYRMQDAMSRLQENGRFAVNQLASEIRMAGYMGCVRLDEAKVNIMADPAPAGIADLLGTLIAVRGENNVASSNEWGASAGTDVLLVHKAVGASMQLTGNINPNNANIQVASNRAGLKQDDTAIISDCTSADIFRVVNNPTATADQKTTITHSSGGNYGSKLSKVYGKDAEVLQFEAASYYIKETSRKSPGGQAIRALYVKRKQELSSKAASETELVEGVQDLQIEYGLMSGTNTFVDEYRTASTVSDWGKVVSVRFRLLMQSADNNAVARSGVAAQSLTFNGASIPADGHLRQEFGSVVAIRNRVR